MANLTDIMTLADSLGDQRVLVVKDRCACVKNRHSTCSRCQDICPTGAVSVAAGKVAIMHTQCEGCGACTTVCPTEALVPLDPTDDELRQRVEALAGQVRLLAVVDTLKYLKMGGRISGATAVVGGLLGICPIITIENGLVASIGKGRGRKAGFQFIARWLEEKEKIDTGLPVAFGHSNAPQVMADCMEFFREQTMGARLCPMDIGSVVGTHVGPGAAGLAFFVKE